MPLGWRLMALVRQPDSDDWLATAAGPLDGQTAHGRGGQPERALRRLADELRPRTTPPTTLRAPRVGPQSTGQSIGPDPRAICPP